MPGDYRKSRNESYYQKTYEARELADRKSKQDPAMREYYQTVGQEAHLLHMWIFDKVDKIWYTPHEFLEKDRQEYIEYEKFFLRIELKNPLAALQQGHKKLQDFATRIIEYERGVRRNKL
jgi:hypothetical protein